MLYDVIVYCIKRATASYHPISHKASSYDIAKSRGRESDVFSIALKFGRQHCQSDLRSPTPWVPDNIRSYDNRCKCYWIQTESHFDGLAQYCSNSIANALVLLQSCTKASICREKLRYPFIRNLLKMEPEPEFYDYIVVGLGGIGSAALYWLARNSDKRK